VLAQESLLVDYSGLERVDSLGIVEVGVDSCVRKGAVLRDRRCLQVRRSLVGERVATGIVVIKILAYPCPQVENGVGAYYSRIGRRDIECSNLGALIGIAHVAKDGIGARAAADNF
jgi:hypothetical protein